MFRRAIVPLASITAITACIPYTVGSTARPLPAGAHSTTMSTFVQPSFGRLDSTHSFSNVGVDFERRWGLDERADIGVRAASAGGLVLNYKRLLSGPHSVTNVAIMPGAGFVNFGQHAYFETTLLISGSEPIEGSTGRDTTVVSRMVPYGGLRVMQVAPIAEGAVNDKPTAGGFAGVRIGTRNFGISPEIGIFYDHSALGLRRSDLVIVPAISVHGDRLIAMIGDMLGRGGLFAMRGRSRRQEETGGAGDALRPPTDRYPFTLRGVQLGTTVSAVRWCSLAVVRRATSSSLSTDFPELSRCESKQR